MTWLNEITAIPALVVWLLIFRGFWPHLRFHGDGPLHFMVQGVSTVAVTLVGRLLFWDLFRPTLRVFGYLPPLQSDLTVSFANAGFNVAATIAGVLILIGLHRTLPPEDQAKFSIWRAPFYPDGILFFRKVKK